MGRRLQNVKMTLPDINANPSPSVQKCVLAEVYRIFSLGKTSLMMTEAALKNQLTVMMCALMQFCNAKADVFPACCIFLLCATVGVTVVCLKSERSYRL